ncbi:MAG: DUF72 domain-containing protein [Crocinitomicaceae bacterium]
MKFGKVDDPSSIDFTLPIDHHDNKNVLSGHDSKVVRFHVGCAKWNKTDLKNFYPRGTKNELAYYSNEFNSIELNATFYRLFPETQFEKWKETTPDHFRFFPKVTQSISQFKRLKDTEELVDLYTNAVRHLDHKLGGVFLQMMHNFAPKDFDRVTQFIEYWPKDIPLSVEFRHTDWYNDSSIANELYSLFENNSIQNVITDTAGRRDLLHMRLTNNKAFIRYVGSNHESDYTRLDDWVQRIKAWKKEGINEVNFFIHQNLELESPLLSTYFIKKLNSELDLDLKVPANLLDKKSDDDKPELF